MKINCKKVVKLFLVFCLTCSLNSFAYPSAEPPLSISGKLSKSTVVGMHLEEVVIEVSGTKNMTVKPDRFGNYMVRNLPRGGTYTITPIDKGLSFSPASRTYRGLTESKINEDYIPTEKTFSISGRVLSGGKPVKGLPVMISHRNNKYFTDQDGYYNIDHLEYNGPYTVSVVADNYAFEPFTIDFLDKDVIHDFSKDIVLSGQVTSFDKPVKNIEIDINGIKYKTDENGNYSVKGSFAGIDCKITLSNESLVANPAYISLTKISNDKENLNFDISAEISGKITYNNAPFKDAIVKIEELNKTHKTDAKGEFDFSNLSLDQEYTVTVSSSGYMFEPAEWKIKNLATENNKKEFVANTKKYKAVITAQKGENPVSGATVTLLETKKTFVTDAQGKCVIPALKFGSKYNISIKKEGVSFIETKKLIENNNDRSMEINVPFDVALTISGTVRKDLKPIANAIVVCGDQKVKSNIKGKYTLKGLRSNIDYTVSVSSGSLVFDQNPITIENLTDSKNNVDFVIDTKKKEEEKKLQLAKEAELKAQEEAKKKAEEERLAKEAEEARLKAEKEEQERLAKEAELKAQEEAKQKEEELRLAKEAEEARIKAEKEEADRIAKIAKEAELKAQEEAKQKEEELRLAKEAEAARLKAEQEEAARIAKEAELKAQEEARLAKEAEAARIKAEKEEAARIAKEEKLRAQEEAKKKAEEARLAKEAEKARIKAEKEEQAKKAKEAKLKAQEEAKKKAEEAKLAKEAEKARLKAEKEEMTRLAKDEAKKKALEKEEKALLAKESKVKFQEETGIKVEDESLDKEAEIARVKAEKEKAEKLAKEAELKAQEEAKLKAEEERLAKEAEEARIKAEKEEAARIAKEAELKAQEEAKLKAEEERLAKEAEEARIKAEKEEAARIAKEAELKAQEEAKLKAEEERLAKEAEEARIKAEKEEAERIAKEAELKAQEEAKQKAEEERLAKEAEAARIKAEKEEAARIAKEEKLKAQEEAKKKAEEERLAKEAEKARIKAEKEEQARLAKEAKLKAQEEAKQKAEEERLAKEAEAARIKAEKEEAARIAKEAELNAQEEAKKKAEEERLAKEKEAEEKKLKENKLSIKGRILKGKEGVSGVQVRVLTEEEEKIYLTDKNGFYKINNLVKGENYTITVISGKTTLELSPKVRVYKKFSKSLNNQNFYVVENYNVTPDQVKKIDKSVSKDSSQNSKDSSYEWNKNYGIKNKDGVIQKDIQW